MQDMTVFGYTISAWIVMPVFFFVWVTALLFVKGIVFRFLKRLTQKTTTEIDDIFIEALDFPLMLLVLASGAAIVEQMTPFITNEELTHYFLISFKAVTVIAIILFADKFLNGLIHLYSDKIDILKSSSSIVRGVVRLIVISLGLLILLDSFGISITPLIASLGIGSLAVALALRPTLENFFSGMQLVIDRPIKIGHFVKLESGEEGYVHKIGWRSTWVRLLANNIVVIPNSSLVNSKIVNYYYPQREMSILVQVGVHYGSDLEKVERVTIEVGREIQKHLEGAVSDFEPFIRYHTFDSSSINFSVILRVKEFVDGYLLKHEFIKKLHKRYKDEGITIPYPIRAINYDQEKAREPLK